MAKYTITYKCGHTAEMQLYGKYVDRDKKIAYYKTIDCPDCRAKTIATEAAKKGYATLIGTEKQVRWANDIRGEKMSDAKKIAEKVNRNKEIFDGAIKKMEEETSASWWISHRDDTIKEILKELLKNIVS